MVAGESQPICPVGANPAAMETVAAFTDSYLPTINGVTYTVRTWRERWLARGGRMDVVYPGSEHVPEPGERPVRSLPFPFYDGYRLGVPRIPGSLPPVDVVHVHTPFSVGVAGLRLARRADVPLVASYHTPTGEYTNYLAPTPRLARGLRRLSESWERRFLDRADLVLAPSEATRNHLRDSVGVSTDVAVLTNGVDTEQFRPVETGAFRERHGLDVDRPLVGYTGRHGYEKCLGELIDAAAGLDVTLVFGGDGPARADLERRADDRGVDARFLGFLDRDELPAFYAALDLFAFPSPVETEGIAAREAAACGTPVVGADSGALVETIESGTIGYRYESGDVADFRATIRRALGEREELREGCLARRDSMSVEGALDRLEEYYAGLRRD
jgi:glycosyltransferase involved in cell wall biosynthesis